MRKVFLDDLPKKEGRGINQEKLVIDWKNSIGCKIPFIYDNIEGEIEIVEYNYKNHDLFIKYFDELFKIKTSGVLKCMLGGVVGKKTKKFKIEIGQEIRDDKRNLVIIDCEYRDCGSGSKKYYKYKCNKCGFDCGEHYKNGEYREELWIAEGNLIKGTGCACCCSPSQITVLGINTIWDTDRWMVDLGLSEEDAKKYSYGSTKKKVIVCPDCRYKKTMRINSIYECKSIKCNCSGKMSYSEKFMINMLRKLNINYIFQLTKTKFKWCEDKKYDFYLPDYNIIIETHGIQHYKHTGFGRTLEEEQLNDKYKYELAIVNGISEYIIIDCRFSNMEWIKNSILNSKLNELFDLSDIDWTECERFALSNIIKEISSHWDNRPKGMTTKEFYKIYGNGLCRKTVTDYLKKGNEYGWCNYNPREEWRKRSSKVGKSLRKKVEMFKDGESLGVFESTHKLAEISEELFGVKLTQGKISDVCRGKRKTHKKFTFKYI